jgi:hypothetical protein
VSSLDILSVISDNLHELNYIHVNMAFNRLGKIPKHRDFAPRHLVQDEAFTGLLRLVRNLAKSLAVKSWPTRRTASRSCMTRAD